MTAEHLTLIELWAADASDGRRRRIGGPSYQLSDHRPWQEVAAAVEQQLNTDGMCHTYVVVRDGRDDWNDPRARWSSYDRRHWLSVAADLRGLVRGAA